MPSGRPPPDLPMEFINLHVSVLDSPQFLTAEPVDRATWLCLYRFCAGQENGGRILGAGAFTDRAWQQLAGVLLKEVRRSSGLWRWDGDDLVVEFYNIEQETQVKRLRSQASAGGRARWHRENGASPLPTAMPQGIPAGTAAGKGDGNAKGKERKGKGKEGKDYPGGQQAAASGQGQGANSKSKAKMTAPIDLEDPTRSRMIEVGALKGRRPDTPWSPREVEAFEAARLGACPAADFEDQLGVMRRYYAAKIAADKDIRRRDLQTLLNNWPGELDRARAWCRANDDGIARA